VHALIASKITVGADAIAMRDHFGIVVGVSFGGGTGGGVWLLVSTASAALCIHCSVYVLGAICARPCIRLQHHNSKSRHSTNEETALIIQFSVLELFHHVSVLAFSACPRHQYYPLA
jgi:hypothetical protein